MIEGIVPNFSNPITYILSDRRCRFCVQSHLDFFFLSFFDFANFTLWISARSYNTGHLVLLANQRLQFLLLVDSGYSVVLFYILVSD